MEIKFRAKIVNRDHKWVYGYYFITPLTEENIECDIKDGHFFLTGKRRHCIATEHGVVYEIDPKTLGQFTNATDSNGKEIYDGDIIDDMAHDNYGVIEWIDTDCCFAVQTGADEIFTLPKHNLYFGETVIGNIHENKDLLKKGKKCDQKKITK